MSGGALGDRGPTLLTHRRVAEIHCFPVPGRNAFDTCVLEQNCAIDGTAEILLQGHAHGTRLNDVRIARRSGIPGILVAPGMPPFENRGTVITPAGADAVVYQ